MESLKMATEQQIQLMERYNLTPEELFVTELLLIAIDGKNVAMLSTYYNLPINKTGLREILTSLQSKGIILKSCSLPNKGENFNLDCIQFNSLFTKTYRKFSGELGQELFNAYPNEAVIQGQSVPLKNFAKRFNNEEECFFQYGKAIGWNPDKHREVLELIQWSKDNDHFGLNMNFADWVISKMWNSIREHRDGNGAITFDTTTSV